MVRLLAENLRERLHQPFIVENRPGAGGVIGTDVVAKAPADGTTILEGPDTLLSVNPSLFKSVPFKSTDLVPLTYLADFSQMLACHPATGIRSLADLLARSKSGSLNYASGGLGSPGHLAMELLLTSTGAAMVHVPYKGAAPAIQDMLAGQVQCGFIASPAVIPQVRDGKLLGVAVSSRTPSLTLPEVPPVADAVPGYDATFAEALFVRAGTPQSVMHLLQSEVARALKRPDIRERLLAYDLAPLGNTPEEAAARLNRDTAKWVKLMQTINLRVDN
ncbi:MAG: tripartite tricarboxylate transporter substrate binding protein [Xanthobacteraceae bacterium]|nr:tripartite tricarboxylate transporter substrate binding protein [Xanthobacteraceae bacterium]